MESFKADLFSKRVFRANDASRVGNRAEYTIYEVCTCDAMVRASWQADNMRQCMTPSCLLHISMRLQRPAWFDDCLGRHVLASHVLVWHCFAE